jgi:hypothetical protein
MTSSGSSDLFVARLSSAGGPVWSKRFGDAGGQSGIRVCVDGADAVILAANTASGSLDFGDGLLTADGNGDGVLAKLAP